MKREGKWRKWQAVRRSQVPSGLSRKNIEVIRALGFGMSLGEASQVLGLSRKTVEYHAAYICRRLNTDLDFIPRIAWAFGLAPLAACLVLLAGCSTSKTISPTLPPEPPALTVVKRPGGVVPVPKAMVTVAPVAGTVTLAWDPGPPKTGVTVTGYRLYQGVKSGAYTNVLNLGKVFSASVPYVSGLSNYFAVATVGATSSGVSNVESVLSNETVFFYLHPSLLAVIKTYVETSTNNVFSSWTTLATYTNTFPGLPDPSFFRTRLSIEVTNSP